MHIPNPMPPDMFLEPPFCIDLINESENDET